MKGKSLQESLYKKQVLSFCNTFTINNNCFFRNKGCSTGVCIFLIPFVLSL